MLLKKVFNFEIDLLFCVLNLGTNTRKYLFLTLSLSRSLWILTVGSCEEKKNWSERERESPHRLLGKNSVYDFSESFISSLSLSYSESKLLSYLKEKRWTDEQVTKERWWGARNISKEREREKEDITFSSFARKLTKRLTNRMKREVEEKGSSFPSFNLWSRLSFSPVVDFRNAEQQLQVGHCENWKENGYTEIERERFKVLSSQLEQIMV